MGKYIFLYCSILFYSSGFSQSWEKLITDGGSTGNEIVSDMDVDDEGNIYVVGTFSGTISFGNTILNSNGSNDFYVAKYDSTGAVVYAVNYGSSAGDFGNAIVADDFGNVYITGQFDQSYLIGGTVLICTGPTDVFTIKLNSTGSVVWAKSAGAQFNIYGDPFRDRGLDIALDNSNGVYISGVHAGQSMNFGSLTLTSAGGVGSSSIDFVGKYNTNGVEQWIVNASVGANFSNNGLAYVLEYNPISNSMIVAGENRIGLSIGPGGQTRFSQIYMRQIQLNGTYGWYREIAGGGQSIPEDLSIASNGDIYLTGYYNGFLTYPSTNTVLVSLNNGQDQNLNDAFILKFNSSASSLIYAKSIVGNQNVESRGIYLDQSDAVYITGLFNGAPTIDNIPLGSTGLSDVFLIRLADIGTVDWIETAGGADEDLATSIYVRNDDKVILSGGFTGTAKFGNQFVNSLGFSDIFIAQIDCKPNIPPIYNGSTQVCLGDTSIYSIPNKVGTEYIWSLSSGGTLDTTGGLVKVIWTAPGNHVLSATPSNVCGIGETRNQIINVNDVPNPPAVAGDTAICVGLGTYNIINPTAQSYQWTLSGGGNLVPLNTQALVSWAGPGNYTLTATGTNECGLGIGNALNISVSQFPISSALISGSTTVCTGPSTYTVDKQLGTNYAWSVTGGGSLTANDTSATINWATPGTYIVRVTPSNVCGSATASSLIVNVIAQPGNVNILGDTLACTGPSSYNLPILSNGLYNWTLSGGGNLVNLGNNIIVNWSAPGNYFITASEQNACGVGIKDTIFVTVRSNAVQPSPITGNSSVCLGTRSYSVAQQSGQTYTWTLSSGGTLNFVNNQASVNWTQSGLHTLTVSTANECGQGQSRNLVVDVKTTPSQPGIIFGSDDVCLGLRNYNVFAESGISYSWSISGGGQIFPSGNSVSVNWTLPGTYDLIVTPSNQCGNGIPRILSVKVKGQPSNISGVSGIDSVCLGNQIYTINNPQTGSDIVYNWSLSGGGLIAPNGNTASINWTTPGTYTLSVQAQNSCGFGQPFSKFITVRNVNEQFSSITGDNLVCIDTSAYQVALIGGFNYNWSLSGGGVLNASNNLAEVIWTNTGNYTLTVATSDGCTKSLPIEVKDIPSQPSVVTGDTVVCFGSRSYAVQPITGQTYNWSTSGGGAISPFGNAAIANWNAVGNYNVSVSSSNLCGTGPQRVLNVDVITVPMSPVFTNPDTLVCKNQSITYSISPNPFESYTWNLNRAGLINPNNDNASVQWLDTGVAILSAIATNQCGTSIQNDFNVRINDAPSLPTILGPLKVCLDSVVYFTAQKPSVTYNWNLLSGGALNTNLNSAGITWANPGLHDLQLSLTNNCGTGPIRTLNIEVFDLPNTPILTQGDTIVCLGLNAYEVQSNPEESYTWTISGGGNLSSQNNTATINWTSIGFHEIFVQASNLCGQSSIDTIRVEVRRIPLQPSLIAGDANVCLDNRTYSVNPVSNITYNWSLNGNGNLIAGDSANVSVDWLNTGLSIISVSASNLCGTGPTQSKSISISDIPQAPVFTGGDTLTCIGQETYSVAASTGLTYNWNISGGGNLSANGNQATINWNQTGNWFISSSLSNFCGTGIEDTLFVRIKTLPNTLTFINPDTIVCLGNTVYQVAPQPEVTYSWTLNGGGSFSSVTNQAFVTWSTPGVYTLSATPINMCGSGISSSTQVDVNSIPSAPVFNNLDTLSCLGNDTYSVFNQSASSFLWNLNSGGGSSSSGNQLNVNWTSTGSFPIEVSAFNFCGTSAITTVNIRVNQRPEKPVLISGDTALCLGFETYLIQSISDETFNWNLSSGGLLNSSSDSAIVNWLVPGNHVISITAENYCGLSQVLQQSISAKDIPSRPTNLTGSTNVCNNDESVYAVQNVLNQTYKWTITNLGTLSSDSNSVGILWNEKGEQILEVSSLNECGESDKNSILVNVRDVPDLQGNILGASKICEGSLEEYSVSSLSGSVYSWDLKSGGEINAQENLATVDWLENGVHLLAISASNICGTGDTVLKVITVDAEPNQPQIIVKGDSLFSSETRDNVWLLNGEVLDDRGVNFIVPELTGRYTLQVVNTCSESAISDFVSFYGGENLDSEVYLIPNPANINTRILIPLNLNIVSVRIINSEGRKVGAIGEINTNEVFLNVDNLNPGFYLIDILISNGERVKKKLVVN